LILILGGAYYYRRRSKKVKCITATARAGDTIAAVQATGTINSLTRVAVGSYVPGTVKYIFADCNTRVSKGQVLAQLDPGIDKAQAVVTSGNLQKARANLVTLAANVQVEQATLAKSQPNVKYQGATAKRSLDLFQSGVVSTDSNDLSHSTLGQTRADVRAQQANLEQAKAQDLLKRPTEVTAHGMVSEKTQYLDDKGERLRLSDLRAGDTVWAVSSGVRDGPSAIWICKVR
jgi:multidrug efflux pump subunit AcrA (membrane-fusion protein)